MNLLGGLWKWAAAAAGLAAAIGWTLFKIADAEAEAATARAEVAEGNLAASQRTREREKRVRRARDKAREAAQAVEADLDRRRTLGQRREGAFGDPRLRKAREESTGGSGS